MTLLILFRNDKRGFRTNNFIHYIYVRFVNISINFIQCNIFNLIDTYFNLMHYFYYVNPFTTSEEKITRICTEVQNNRK